MFGVVSLPGVTRIEFTRTENGDILGVVGITFYDLFEIYPYRLRGGDRSWLEAPASRGRNGWRALIEPLQPDIETSLLEAVKAIAEGRPLAPAIEHLTLDALHVRYRPFAGRDGLTAFADITIAETYFIHSFQVFGDEVRGPRRSGQGNDSTIRFHGEGRRLFEKAFQTASGIGTLRWEESTPWPTPQSFAQPRRSRRRERIPLAEMAAHDLSHLADAKWIIGVDEVGTGAIAGPIAVGAAAFPREMLESPPESLRGITDSKMLDELERERFAAALRDLVPFEVEMMGPDRLRQTAESRCSPVRVCQEAAISRLLARLGGRSIALVDAGPWSPTSDCDVKRIPDGDRLSLSIAAGAIMAKTTRDKEMIRLAREFPAYRWERNKGYLTPEHAAGLEKHGETPHHRKAPAA